MLRKTKKVLYRRGFWIIGWMAATVLFLGFAAAAAEPQEEPAYRASQLMDHPVINGSGKEIAEIDDLILRRGGKVKRAILSCCGFLGLGTKKVAVPLRRLQFKKDEILFDITEEEFTQMAEFDYAQEGLYTGYYSARPGATERGIQRIPYPGYGYYDPYYPRHRAPLTAPEPDYCPWEWSHSPGSILCTAVLGRAVVNSQCQRIGFVNDLLIGPDHRVKDIVLSLLRSEKDRVSLPYRPFEVTYWGLAYDITREEIRDLPEFHYQEAR
jgi:sporulation protein YlmC with PRC-barrel domain